MAFHRGRFHQQLVSITPGFTSGKQADHTQCLLPDLYIRLYYHAPKSFVSYRIYLYVCRTENANINAVSL